MKNNVGMGLFLLAGAAFAGYFGFRIHTWRHQAAAITVIGGSDGPTSIFLAGKLPAAHHLGMTAGGLILLFLFIVLFIRSRHQKNRKE